MPQRRITPEILARVKELRSQGVNITRITTMILEEFGKAFGTTTLKYWLEPKYKEKIKRRNMAYFKSRWRESSAFREKKKKVSAGICTAPKEGGSRIQRKAKKAC